MKAFNLLMSLVVFLGIAASGYAADVKISALTADSSATPDDLLAEVDCNGTTYDWTCASGTTKKATRIEGIMGALYGTGSNLTAGRAYYLAATTGALTEADATSAATLPSPAVCVAVSTNVCAKSGRLITSGLTAGSVYYVKVGGGLVTTTVPSATGNQIQRIGVASSTTVLEIMPSIDVGEAK